MTVFPTSFRPSFLSTLTLGGLVLVFFRLAVWQLDSKAEKEILVDQFDNAPTLMLTDAIEREVRFARVTLSGHFDQRSVLLDNKVFRGRAGVNVLTPLLLKSGQSLLINRGWLPLSPDRRTLPLVPSPTQTISISGILNTPPISNIQLGEPDLLNSEEWPKLVTYLDVNTLSDRLGVELLPWVIQMDATDNHGFEDRHWQAATMTAAKHGAYAVQWFALALGAFGCWLMLALRRSKFQTEDKG